MVAETQGVARSNLIDRLQGRSRPQRGYHKAEDVELVLRIMALVAARPTYGYRRITAILNRQPRSGGGGRREDPKYRSAARVPDASPVYDCP